MNGSPWAAWFEAANCGQQASRDVLYFGDAGLMLKAAAQGQGVCLANYILAEKDLLAGRLVKLFDISVGLKTEGYYMLTHAALAGWLASNRLSPRLAPAGRGEDREPTADACQRSGHSSPSRAVTVKRVLIVLQRTSNAGQPTTTPVTLWDKALPGFDLIRYHVPSPSEVCRSCMYHPPAGRNGDLL